ncbi:MAG: hypothetical protein PHU12_04255, partial [Candidatus Aenigmarchaeota archaeon]|nr:hypothetical protein [Candidatus Aenigmarchaeota archaeon]
MNNFNNRDYKKLSVNGLEKPAITNIYTDPNDVWPGDKMLVSADVRDNNGIRNVTATMPNEKGSDLLNMNLVLGDKYNGTWQSVWDVHDTLVKNYTSVVRAVSEDGDESEEEVGWSDSISECNPETGSCETSDCSSVFSVQTIDWSYAFSFVCIDSTNMYVVQKGSFCHAPGNISDGICAFDQYNFVECPSYARMGRPVTSEDCPVGAFNFSNPFFAGAGSSGITYTSFSGKGETTNLSALNLTNDLNVSDVILDTAGPGKIKFLQNITLNNSYNLDNAVVITPALVRVNSTLYSSLNKSAEITVRGITGIGYPVILKDGVACADCVISKWDKSVGELVFNVSSFSDYTWQEANQSKVQNNGTYNISFYLLMKTQRFNAGSWVDEDIVVNDSASSTLRTVNTSSLLKLDAGIWNAAAYNSSNLSGGDGIYRVYVALQDTNGNVLVDNTGINLTASYNFTLDNNAPYFLNLTAPVNNSAIDIASNNVSFNWTVMDAIDSSLTCNLTLDSVVQGINVNSNNGTNTNYTVNNIANGNHLWNVSCWDDAMNMNTSATFNFSISDMVYPIVNITYPLNTTYNINVSAINYTLVETNPSRCWYSNSSGVWNSTDVAAGTNFTGVISVEGSNTWTVYCNDTSGNVNSTTTVFSVDSGLPAVNIVTITPSITGLGQFVNISANATDNSGVSAVWVGITAPGQVQVNYTMSNYSV